MGKRKEEMPDNLVMLLDTMCNLLGGLILISIMLALAPRGHGEDDSALRKDVEKLREQAAGLGILTNALSAVEVTNRIRAASSTNLDTRLAIGKLNQNIENKKQNLARTKADAAQIHKELEAAKVAIGGGVRATTRTPVIAVLSKGQLYTVVDITQPKRASVPRRYDSTIADVKRLQLPDGSVVMEIALKEGMGQRVQAGAETQGALGRLLANVDPAAEFVNLAVYPDSYGEFNNVKARLVEKRIGYNWFPMAANQPIHIYPPKEGDVPVINEPR